MNYNELIDSAINNISIFFKTEFQFDCKSELSKKIEEYEIIVKNDKNDFVVFHLSLYHVVILTLNL